MNSNLKKTVGQVLEGWTLPVGVRKMLETAYFADEDPTESPSFEEWFASWRNIHGTPETIECDKYASRAGWDAALKSLPPIYQVGTRVIGGILWGDVDRETYERREAERNALVRIINVIQTSEVKS